MRVILAIADAKRAEPYRPPSLDFLAFTSGLSEEDFNAYVQRMQAHNLVKVLDHDPKHYDVDLSRLYTRIDVLSSEDEQVAADEDFEGLKE